MTGGGVTGGGGGGVESGGVAGGGAFSSITAEITSCLPTRQALPWRAHPGAHASVVGCVHWK